MTVNFKNIEKVKISIQNYNKSTKLLVVTKNRSLEDIRLLIQNNFLLLGENRVQEAKKKYQDLINLHKISLHLIGNLQTNKVHEALKLFDVIQTIDRPKIIFEILKYLKKPDAGIRTKQFYLQINIGDEAQKNGVSIKEVDQLYQICRENNLNVVGLMCIPPNDNNPLFYFKKMRGLRDSINKNLKLSMGMSNDYIEALVEGSDIIRIGSFLFE